MMDFVFDEMVNSPTLMGFSMISSVLYVAECVAFLSIYGCFAIITADCRNMFTRP